MSTMERMRGMDAAFLAMETAAMHMHMVGVLIFEPPEHGRADPPALQVERMRRVVAERLHLVPLLRRRVVTVPFGMGHPLWADDAAFDLDYHFQRASLPAPGGVAELCSFASAVASRALDLRRPLWEMHVVEGLESGHVAVVTKLHHAAIDGVSGAETLAAFLDTGPEERVVDPPGRPWRPAPVPGDLEVLASSLSSMTRQPERAVDTVRRTLGAFQQLSARNRRLREEDEVEPPPAPFRAPRTSLNGSISAQRRVGVAEVPLDEVQRIRHVFGGTLNDVVLAAVAGALRRLLTERGESPNESLVAMVPISVRSEEDRGTQGNKLSAMLVSLATTVADPVERLRLVSEGTRLAKAQARVLSEDLVRGWAQLAFPAFSARLARLSSNLKLFDRLPPLFNVVVSNIPGPPVPLWWGGARLAALYPVGPILEGVGLNVTVVSYTGTLYLGLNGCRELVPEVDHVASLLTDAFVELSKSAARHGDQWG